VPLLVEWPDGRRAALLFVVEEETRARRFDIYRLAHYVLDLAVLCGTNRVVPVVIFLDEGGAPEQLGIGGDEDMYLTFRYLACRLSRLPYRAYRDSDNVVARLNLPNMAWRTRAEKLDAFAAAVRGLFELEGDGERRTKYADFIDIYGRLDEDERAECDQRYPQESATMAGVIERTVAEARERAMQEGRQEGRREGRQEGRQEGEAAMLMRLLERRFGAEAAARHQAKVHGANTETLMQWSERTLTAATIEEVFR